MSVRFLFTTFFYLHSIKSYTSILIYLRFLMLEYFFGSSLSVKKKITQGTISDRNAKHILKYCLNLHGIFPSWSSKNYTHFLYSKEYKRVPVFPYSLQDGNVFWDIILICLIINEDCFHLFTGQLWSFFGKLSIYYLKFSTVIFNNCL